MSTRTAHRIEFPEQGRAELRPFELAPPGPGEVQIEAEYSVISAGTEGASFTGLELEHPGRNPAFAYPRTATGYGHLGRIREVGPGVEGLHAGDRMLTLCPHASRWNWKAGGLGIRVPERLPGERAVFIRMAGVGIAAVRKSTVQPGDTVAVIGLGLVGNFAAQLFQLAGAEVLGLDVEAARLEQARACGLRHLASTRERAVQEVVNEWTGGRGARIVVEAIGEPVLIEQAVLAARRHGEVILLGSPRRRVTMEVTPLLSRVHLLGIHLIGALEWLFPIHDSDHSRHSVMENFRQISGWIADGRLQVDPLRTHVLSPEECQRAYDGVTRERSVYTGVVFDWSRLPQ